MAKVFVSFLGTGSLAKDPGYDKATYNWPGKSELKVTGCFAQTAILKILEAKAGEEGPVDKVVFLCTKESKEKHLQALRDELQEHLSAPPEPIVPEPLVPTDMSPEHQWGWFEQLLDIVEHNDTLIIDFTHGMRAVPIVFSSAIGFLQRAKGVTLAHALYGWYDVADKAKVHPIVDMRDFYVINDWAEAVSRLADEADARKLGDLAKTTGVQALQPLADENLIKAFEEMTDCIRNVDVNNIGRKVSAALERVEQAQARAESGSARVMLKLVREKFSTLTADTRPSVRYDKAYFESQLEIIKVLLEHRLFMQTFTAMREFVGSLGMVGAQGNNRKYADVFVNMLQFRRKSWNFKNNDKYRVDLMLWYEELEKEGVEAQLRPIVTSMVKIRNSFDHAWIPAELGETVEIEQEDIEKDGYKYHQQLKNIVEQLERNGQLDRQAPPRFNDGLIS